MVGQHKAPSITADLVLNYETCVNFELVRKERHVFQRCQRAHLLGPCRFPEIPDVGSGWVGGVVVVGVGS